MIFGMPPTFRSSLLFLPLLLLPFLAYSYFQSASFVAFPPFSHPLLHHSCPTFAQVHSSEITDIASEQHVMRSTMVFYLSNSPSSFNPLDFAFAPPLLSLQRRRCDCVDGNINKPPRLSCARELTFYRTSHTCQFPTAIPVKRAARGDGAGQKKWKSKHCHLRVCHKNKQ